MPTLVATLAALDRYSLASKRAITMPLLKDWMQRGLGFSGQASPGPAGASPTTRRSSPNGDKGCRAGGLLIL